MDSIAYLLGALFGIATALFLGEVAPRLVYARRGWR
jgi:hypothetical protein